MIRSTLTLWPGVTRALAEALFALGHSADVLEEPVSARLKIVDRIPQMAFIPN